MGSTLAICNLALGPRTRSWLAEHEGDGAWLDLSRELLAASPSVIQFTKDEEDGNGAGMKRAGG